MWDSATRKVYAKFVEIRCSENVHFSLRKISAFCKEKVTYIFCSLTPIKSKKIHPNSSVNDIHWASCNVYALHLAIQRYSFIRLIRIAILFDEIKLITGLQIFTQICIFDNIIKNVGPEQEIALFTVLLPSVIESTILWTFYVLFPPTAPQSINYNS